MSYPQGYPDNHYPAQSNQYNTQRTNATGVPQQQRQSTRMPQAPLASTTPQVLVSSSRDYQQQSNQYGTHPTSAINIPQQRQRTGMPQGSAQVSVSPNRDYQQQSYQGQQGYTDPAYTAGYTTAVGPTPAFPVPSSGGSYQRSPGGQSATLYPQADGSIQRSTSGHSASRYPLASGSIRRSPSAHTASLYPSATGSIRRSPSAHSATLYPTATGTSPAYSGQSGAHHYAPAQTYDTTGTSYSGSQQTSRHAVPHGHGTNASGGSRSGNLYQTTAHSTRVDPEPTYEGTYPQEGSAGPHSQTQRGRDVYRYNNEGSMNENRSKSPGRGPAQGRQYYCRMSGCNQPMFFDRRFNEFWEWCSIQHIQVALQRSMEKPCRTCGIWPRKYGHKHCGGPSCNKRGYPLSTY